MERYGYIYKITNKINGKIYIGQTKKSIQIRFKRHYTDSKRNNRKSFNFPLYRAFRKYGIENFSIEEIEKCEYSKLDEREIFWIKYYNSYNCGYNQTLGGEGKKTLDINENEIINKYYELKNISATAAYFSCCNQVISQVLSKNDITKFKPDEINQTNSNHIYQYDYDGNLLNIFTGKTKLGKWLIDNGFSKSKSIYYAADNIRKRFLDKKYNRCVWLHMGNRQML